MKTMLMITFLLVIAAPGSCDDIIYDDHFGGRAIGRITEDGKIYDDRYGGRVVGRIEEDGRIYDDIYGGRCAGRIESNDKDNSHRSRGGAAYFLLRESHENHDREDY